MKGHFVFFLSFFFSCHLQLVIADDIELGEDIKEPNANKTNRYSMFTADIYVTGQWYTPSMQKKESFSANNREYGKNDVCSVNQIYIETTSSRMDCMKKRNYKLTTTGSGNCLDLVTFDLFAVPFKYNEFFISFQSISFSLSNGIVNSATNSDESLAIEFDKLFDLRLYDITRGPRENQEIRREADRNKLLPKYSIENTTHLRVLITNYNYNFNYTMYLLLKVNVCPETNFLYDKYILSHSTASLQMDFHPFINGSEPGISNELFMTSIEYLIYFGMLLLFLTAFASIFAYKVQNPWAIIDFYQIFNVLKFIPINFGENIDRVQNMMNWINLAFLPNFLPCSDNMQDYLIDSSPPLFVDCRATLRDQVIHDNFTANNVSSNFLINSGFQITVVLVLVGIYRFFSVINHYFPSWRIPILVLQKFHFTIPIRFIMMFLVYFSLNVFLQVGDLSFNGEIMTSLSCGLVSFLFIPFCLSPIFLSYFLIKGNHLLHMNRLSDQLGAFYEDFKFETTFTRNFNVVIIMRKILSTFTIAVFYNSPGLQLIMLGIVSIFYLITLCLCRPYKSITPLICAIVNEMSLIFFWLLAFISFTADTNENIIFLAETRTESNWPFLFFLAVLFVTENIASMVELIMIHREKTRESRLEKQENIKNINTKEAEKAEQTEEVELTLVLPLK